MNRSVANFPLIRSVQRPLEKVITRLDGVLQSGDSYRAICPAHTSRHGSASLSLKETPEGGVLLHCFAGCGAHDVLAAIGLELKDLYPESIEHIRPGRAYTRRAAFTPREALKLLSQEVMIASIFISDVIAGRQISQDDWQRFLMVQERITQVAGDYMDKRDLS